MKKITWSNVPGQRYRDAWLLLTNEEIISFEGKSIEGFCVVTGSNYKKDGKWSNTTFRITLAEGVRAIPGNAGWETGTFLEGLGRATGNPTPDTWVEVAKCFGTSVPAAMRFLREWKPKEADFLDETERAIEALEESSSDDMVDAEKVTVDFGSPTNRQIKEGWWNMPKEIPGYEAEIRLVDQEAGWSKDNIKIVGISGAVLSSEHARGMHGGYYAVTVAVLPGTEVAYEPQTFEVGGCFGNNAFADAFKKRK